MTLPAPTGLVDHGRRLLEFLLAAGEAGDEEVGAGRRRIAQRDLARVRGSHHQVVVVEDPVEGPDIGGQRARLVGQDSDKGAGDVRLRLTQQRRGDAQPSGQLGTAAPADVAPAAVDPVDERAPAGGPERVGGDGRHAVRHQQHVHVGQRTAGDRRSPRRASVTRAPRGRYAAAPQVVPGPWCDGPSSRPPCSGPRPGGLSVARRCPDLARGDHDPRYLLCLSCRDGFPVLEATVAARRRTRPCPQHAKDDAGAQQRLGWRDQPRDPEKRAGEAGVVGSGGVEPGDVGVDQQDAGQRHHPPATLHPQQRPSPWMLGRGSLHPQIAAEGIWRQPVGPGRIAQPDPHLLGRRPPVAKCLQPE
jgi:hypothetical protein